MTRYLWRRVGRAVGQLVGLAVVDLVVFYLLPGRGLARYGDDIKALVLHLDLGYSAQRHETVRALIDHRLGATVSLAAGGVVVGAAVALLVGTIAAARRRSRVDRAAMSAALVAMSAPPYWLALIALYLFSSDVGRFAILPGAGGYASLTSDPGTWFTSLLMPWLVLAASLAGIYARLLRDQLGDALSQSFTLSARAEGLPDRDVIVGHGLRAAAPALAADSARHLGVLAGGVILVESAFRIPGAGQLAARAVASGDVSTVHGVVLAGAIAVVVLSLVVDLSLAVADPRIRRA
jgi:peptide/nickel transport system permease protein